VRAVNRVDRIVAEMLPHRHHVCDHVRSIAFADVDAQLSPAWTEKVRMHGGLPAAYVRLVQCKMQRKTSSLGEEGRQERVRVQTYHNALLLCRFAHLAHVPR